MEGRCLSFVNVFAVIGNILSQVLRYLKWESVSFQKNWFITACMPLTKKIFKEYVKEKMRDDKRCMSRLGWNEVKNKTVLVKECGGYNDGASGDSLIPGLNNDTALDILARCSRSDYQKLACLNKKFKALIGSGYLFNLRRQLGIIEYSLYLYCSSMPWEAFDLLRRKWKKLPTIPCDDCFTFTDKESLAVGTQLLIFGRELPGFTIWKYSLITHDWCRCNPMNSPRCLFASGSLGEIAIVAGGCDMDGRVLKSVEVYNSEMHVWETLPDMNLPRKLCSGFFMDGKFYVIGGMSTNADYLTCGEEYNFETRTWRRIMGMYRRSTQSSFPFTQSPPLVAVASNELYAADQSTNELKKYNKENNTWSIVNRLPLRVNSHNGWGLAFKACGDTLIVVGGHRVPLQRELLVLHYWWPEVGNFERDWNVVDYRERAGGFVYNCAVMSC